MNINFIIYVFGFLVLYFAEAFSSEYAYTVNPNGNNVSVIDTASQLLIKTITVGHNPRGLAIIPDAT